MFSTLFISVIAFHLAACFYFLIAKLDGWNDETDWVHYINRENVDPLEQYLVSINWSLQTLTTVGFGDCPARTDY